MKFETVCLILISTVILGPTWSHDSLFPSLVTCILNGNHFCVSLVSEASIQDPTLVFTRLPKVLWSLTPWISFWDQFYAYS